MNELFINGRFRKGNAWCEAFRDLQSWIPGWLENSCDTALILTELDRFAAYLREDRTRFRVQGRCLTEAELTALDEILDFLSAPELRKKVARELGQGNPWQRPEEFRRSDPDSGAMECWAPLGVLVHIAPSNAPGAGILSVVEGLLSGNISVLKVSRGDRGFSASFFSLFIAFSCYPALASFVHVCRLERDDSGSFNELLSLADGVVVWGGEGAVRAVRASLRSGCRVIDWGPRLSFVVVARECLQDPHILKNLAETVVAFEQQTCTSPQCVLIEAPLQAEREPFAASLQKALEEAGLRKGRPPVLSMQEHAEITNLTEISRLDSLEGEVKVFESVDRSSRVILEEERGPAVSPLNRTIRVRCVKAGQLVQDLYPFRHVLQTAGLACSAHRISEFTDALVRGGVLRITSVERMLDSWPGEPHDGEYALQRYSRRVSLRHPEIPKGLSLSLAREGGRFEVTGSSRVMSKNDFQSADLNPAAHLYFKSGGSSGKATVSPFTWDEYRYQMYYAASGLLAAGLDPASDICMNLFYGGRLHGGFLSFFTILEYTGAKHLPAGADQDFDHIADLIMQFGVNCLLGMPGYLMALLQSQAEKIKKSGVRKIFYGGEPFSRMQKEWIRRECGIDTIKSASYGSVDAGPVGYQCSHLDGKSHHLHHNLHFMEVLSLDSDKPAEPGQTGRLILTSRARNSIRLVRYDLGDVGRLREFPCACGRKSPVFDLEGRRGDIFKAGGNFLNYYTVQKILREKTDVQGDVQITLSQERLHDLIVCKIGQKNQQYSGSFLRQSVLENYDDLREVWEEGLLELKVIFVDALELEYVPGTRKKKNVLDLRS